LIAAAIISSHIFGRPNPTDFVNLAHRRTISQFYLEDFIPIELIKLVRKDGGDVRWAVASNEALEGGEES